MPRFPKQEPSEPTLQPRLATVEPPYDAETAEALEALGPPIALFRIFVRRPERARAILGWGRYYLSRRFAMTLRHRELVILRTTARCGAEYEWGVHVSVFAAKAGLDDGQIRSVVSGDPGDPCWTDPSDRAVLRAVDDLCDHHDLPDEPWRDLIGQVGEEAAIDLLLLCGWYHAISFVAQAVRLPPEPGTPAFADYAEPEAQTSEAHSIPPLPPEDHRCERCDVTYPDVTVEEAAEVIGTIPDRVRAAVQPLADPLIRRRIDERTWSVVEYLAHLRDVFATYTIRLHRTRTEDRPALEPMLNDLRARRFRYNDGDPAAFLDQLADTAAGFLDEIARTRDHDWTRLATRRPGERRTARWLVRQAMHEGVHHLRDIRDLVETS